MTIAERAKQYAQHYADTSNTEQSQYTFGKVVGMQRGYVQGATDQQNIDIEKAIDIFCEEACAFIKHESCDVNCPYVERIHKAMKGE